VTSRGETTGITVPPHAEATSYQRRRHRSGRTRTVGRLDLVTVRAVDGLRALATTASP
jgi:hypothetical protein